MHTYEWCSARDLPTLPDCRKYVVPFPGHVLIDRDYSQQEPRILAHYVGGDLLKAYQDDPWTDLHDYAQGELAKLGLFYDRKVCKGVNLGLLYGMGIESLARHTGLEVSQAKQLKNAIMSIYSGLGDLQRTLKSRAGRGLPFTTWGGRRYFVEPPRYVEGEYRTYEYKMTNLLIQGSGADVTKQAIINFYHVKQDNWYLILNVHDEIVVSVPKEDAELAMDYLKDAMEIVNFKVKMKSEGKIGESLGALMDYDKKGVLCVS